MEPAEAQDPSKLDASRAGAPTVRDPLGRELQKWIQCTKCEKWRKIPYSIDTETQIPEDWSCANNVWDDGFALCSVPQQLSDDEIDAVLQLQEEQLGAAEAAAAQAPLLHRDEYAATHDDASLYDDDDYEDNSRRHKKTNGRWARSWAWAWAWCTWKRPRTSRG